LPSSSEAQSQSQASQQSSSQPVEPTAPSIVGSNFYKDDPSGSTSIMVVGLGRYPLSAEYAKEFYGGIAFDKLTPISGEHKMNTEIPEPAVEFLAPDFSYDLRLEKNSGIARFIIGGTETYYYKMPDGFYDEVAARATTYYDYQSQQEAQPAESGEVNAITG